MCTKLAAQEGSTVQLQPKARKSASPVPSHCHAGGQSNCADRVTSETITTVLSAGILLEYNTIILNAKSKDRNGQLL